MSSLFTDPRSRDPWRDINWFAIQARPRREIFAAQNIEKLGIEVLLPRIRFERLIRGSARSGTKPLFPGYFFSRFCPEAAFESVKVTRGVLRVLNSGRIPIPVPAEVIREIQ